MAISLRLSKEEEELVRRYAELRGETVSDVMREAILEKIEDEYDLREYDKAMEVYRKNPVSYSLEEAERELGFGDV